MSEHLDAVRRVSPEDFEHGFAVAAAAGHPVDPWRRHVERAGALWVRAYVDAMRRAAGPAEQRRLDRRLRRRLRGRAALGAGRLAGARAQGAIA